MIDPKVSIIITVYNGSEYISQAIDSALSQSYSNIEVIVVNDGSSDGGKTDAICKQYGDKIRYFIKENGKCSSALNYGISKMTGEFFSWLSHDDLYCVDKIEKQINVIQNCNIDTNKTIIGCASSLIDKNGKHFQNRKNTRNGFVDSKREIKDLFFKSTPNGNSFLISKNILQAVGDFDTSLVFINDLDYWLRVALKGFNFYFLPEPLAKTRIHAAQQTKKLYGLMHNEIVKCVSNYVKEELYNSDYYKTIYYYSSYFGDKDLKKTVRNVLSLNGIKVSHVKSLYYKIYGAIIRFLKRIKHYLVYKR